MPAESQSRPSFAFLVITYNHQAYIVEHLESIKFLVLSYAEGIDVDLIVNDDCSRDQTCSLIDGWLDINVDIFRRIEKIYNSKNIGTCASVNNMLSLVNTDRCKLTAGDDVYSFENIFELSKTNQDVAMLSGRVLYLVDNGLMINKMHNNMATATQIVYSDDTLLHMLKHFSYINTPNLLYSTKYLLKPTVREFLTKFKVTEDFPLQIAIARQFPEGKYLLIDEVFVYYRRTSGSTYIVANDSFVLDKNLIYKNLIENEASWLERVRLLVRKFCFNSGKPWINRLLNIDFYAFVFSYLFNFLRIVARGRGVDMKLDKHREHYARIRLAASVAQCQIDIEKVKV